MSRSLPALRLLHLIPSLGGGGAERQLACLAGEQVRRGHQVTVASFSGGIHDAAARDAGGTVVRLTHGHRHPFALAELVALLRRLAPDVVHTWLYSMDVLGGLAARLTRTPWILCERCGPDCYPDSPRSRLRRRIGRAANAVVANSRQGCAYWSDLVGAQRCFVAPNALTRPDSGAAAALPTPLASLGDRPLVLFAARLEEQKNVRVTLRAFEVAAGRHTSAVFALCGEGPLQPAVADALRIGPLAGRAHLLGYCAELDPLLKTAAAFVSLSRYEGQPNAVLEAMAAGCPLIVSDIPAHRELLDERSAIVVGCDDAESAAAAITCVLDQPDAARRRAAAARSLAAQFTPQRTGDHYDDVYQQLQLCAAS